MPRRSSKNNNRRTHLQKQKTCLTQQENITSELNPETITPKNEEIVETLISIEDENKNPKSNNQENEKNIKTPENKEKSKDQQDNKTIPSSFLANMANSIINRLHRIYGYSIKGDRCRSILKTAQSYARRENIKLQDHINEIYIRDLYPNILNILSLGYIPSPLDNTYNDILVRAIVDKYKI